MATLSLLDKLKILLDVSKSSGLFIVAIVAILVFGIILFTTNRMNAKSSRRLFVALYAFLIVAAFVIYKDSLNHMVEYMMNNVFMLIYFPNLAIYFVSIVVANIILWVSVFNFKTPKVIKSINIVVYSLISYLLVALLTIINENKLDVFSQTSVYANKSAQAIIELTSMVFILWMLFLCFYKAIRIFQTKDNKFESKYMKKKTRRLPKNVVELPMNYIVKAPEVPKVEQPKNPKMKELQNLLTIDDYKLLLNILKEKREKEKEIALQKQREERELAKYRELQELYGVRQ